MLGPNGAVPSPALTASPTPVLPGQTSPVASASVTITDTIFQPAIVSLYLNGTVTWTNNGTAVHTATSTSDTNSANLPPFDTGGLGPGQSSSLMFSTPGTYVYYSAPDCFKKSKPPSFNCATYEVVVADTPVPQAAHTGATPTSVVVAGANASIGIDDTGGFQPDAVTIRVGQTVGWLNTGSQTHSVVLNQNPQPGELPPWWLPYQVPSTGGVSFDSGGIGPQQTFTYTFTIPGTFPYHSSTEPVYLANQTNCSCTFVTYKFFGTVVVTP